MPTPIAHALGGIAAGCLAAAGASLVQKTLVSRNGFGTMIVRIGSLRAATGLACLGMLPDIDLVFGSHRTFTHSVSATLLLASIASAIAPTARPAVALTAAAAFGSHVLLDWLGTDLSAPRGVAVWWPWTNEYYLSDLQVFMRVRRGCWTPECWRHNSLAVLREITILVPVTLAAVLMLRRSLPGRGPL